MKDQVFGQEYADQYDSLYKDKDYEHECDVLEAMFRRYGNGEVNKILDLGCGTGNHAIPLSLRGYNVTGVDKSSEMLMQAKNKAANLEGQNVINSPVFYQNDICYIDLSEKYDAVLMMFAVLGYQLTNKEVEAALKNVQRHLRSGGIFVFDIWYGPAVLSIRPSDRIKVLPTIDGQLIRAASSILNLRSHLCEIQYKMWRLSGDKVTSMSSELHRMRYFFPLEVDLWLRYSGMKLKTIVAFPDIEREPDESSWNVLCVGQAAE